MSSQLTNITNGLKAALAACAPDRTISDTRQEFADKGDDALIPGIFTLVPAGRPDSDTNLYYQDYVVLGQQFIPQATLEDTEIGTPGQQITEAEGAMIDEINLFAMTFGNQVEIHGIRQSMQLESPYCWVAVDIRVGPFSMDIQEPAGLQPLTQIQFTIDATEPNGGAPTISGLAKPAQP